MLGDLSRTLQDPTYWVQCISAAIASFAVLDSVKKDTAHPWIRCLLRISLLIVLFFSIHLVLSVITLYNRGFAGIGTWLAYLGGVAFYSAFLIHYDARARIVNASAVTSVILILFELSAVFGRALQLGLGTQGILFDSAIIKILGCTVLLIAGRSMSRCRISKYYVSSAAVWLNLVACSAAGIVVTVFDLYSVHLFEMGGDWKINSLMSVNFLAFFLVAIVCYYMAYYLCREYTKAIDLNAQNQMNKSAESLMTLTDENLTEIHKIRHDIKNQYTYMQAMLERGELEELKKYFEELTSTFAEPLGRVEDYGNHAMNLIFAMERAKANANQIQMDVMAVVPAKMPFSDRDLVKLYTNLIDNALEACASEKTADPKVSVAVRIHGDYLVTRISNPTVKSESFLKSGSPTTKMDARLHGKGISIVKDIVKKYDGTISYQIENGEFSVKFMLRMQEGNNE